LEGGWHEREGGRDGKGRRVEGKEEMGTEGWGRGRGIEEYWKHFGSE
jgi:hypothetical protein